MKHFKWFLDSSKSYMDYDGSNRTIGHKIRFWLGVPRAYIRFCSYERQDPTSQPYPKWGE